MALVDGAVADLTAGAVRGRLERRGRDWSGGIFRAVLLVSLFLSLVFLVVLLYQVLRDGLPVFADRGLDFITSGTSSRSEEAGVWQALVGSFWIAAFVVTLAFPLGIAAAIYLEEYARDTRLTRLIDTNIRNLAGVPSIVYGILGFSLFVKSGDWFTGGRSVISGGLTLAILVLPIVIITSAEALRAVPQAIREAGYGVGATQWEVTRHHVIPYAAPGILTGTVLALARALGEAAPLILVGAATGFFGVADSATFTERLQGPFTALPNLTYSWIGRPTSQGFEPLAAAAIVVMLVVVLTANTAAVLLRARFDKKRS